MLASSLLCPCLMSVYLCFAICIPFIYRPSPCARGLATGSLTFTSFQLWAPYARLSSLSFKLRNLGKDLVTQVVTYPPLTQSLRAGNWVARPGSRVHFFGLVAGGRMGYITRRELELHFEVQSTIRRPLRGGRKDVNALQHKRRPRKNLSDYDWWTEKEKRKTWCMCDCHKRKRGRLESHQAGQLPALATPRHPWPGTARWLTSPGEGGCQQGI